MLLRASLKLKLIADCNGVKLGLLYIFKAISLSYIKPLYPLLFHALLFILESSIICFWLSLLLIVLEDCGLFQKYLKESVVCSTPRNSAQKKSNQ